MFQEIIYIYYQVGIYVMARNKNGNLESKADKFVFASKCCLADVIIYFMIRMFYKRNIF